MAAAITEEPARHAALVEVGSGASTLLARVTPDAVARLKLAPGSRVLSLLLQCRALGDWSACHGKTLFAQRPVFVS